MSHGHVVVFHDCPDPQAFQDLFPQATIEYLSSLPGGLLAEGHKILDSQREACQQQVVRPSAITPPCSIVAWYVAAGFGGGGGGGGGGPSPPTTTASLSSSSTRSGLLRSPSASRGRDLQSPSVNAPRESSTVPATPRRSASLRPDPEGDDIPVGYFHGGLVRPMEALPPAMGGSVPPLLHVKVPTTLVLATIIVGGLSRVLPSTTIFPSSSNVLSGIAFR
jgi:hypothetical protein